jgi:hypothetical protein
MLPALILLLACAATPKDVPSPGDPARGQHAASALAVDEGRARAAGIRKLASQHLTLYTDLPVDSGVDELPAIFDQAYVQWCKYFGQTPRLDPPWSVIACVIRDKQKFVRVGLMPKDLPPFLHAYFRGNQLWVYDQPSAYYRRHLLLHEGTHAFMHAHLGSCGPPWYKEGMAELLATHAIEDGGVVLNHFPVDAEEVPDWGRIRLVHDALAAGRGLKMDEVLDYGSQAHVEVEPYGWCWGAAAFLDGHPRYRRRFRHLPADVKAADFNEQVRKLFAADWPRMAEEWQLFVEQLDFGYEFAREAIDFRSGKPLPSAGATVEVAADRGWQSSCIELEAGRAYRLRASGRYQVGNQPRPWWSEPDGVTIRYWHGKRLGALLGAVHPEPFDPHDTSALVAPVFVGTEGIIRPNKSGTLYLRVNDSPAGLADNAGSVQVRVSKE